MRLRTTITTTLCLPALVIGLAACGSSTSSTSAAGSAASSRAAGATVAAATTTLSSAPSPAPTPAATASPVPTPTPIVLTKRAFISQANAACKSENIKMKALNPGSASDYATLAAAYTGAMQVETEYLQQVSTLVNESPDAAALKSNWIDVATSDYMLAQPLLTQLIAAAQAKNDDQISAVEDQLDASPDHSKQMASYLKGYGLLECAEFQDS